MNVSLTPGTRSSSSGRSKTGSTTTPVKVIREGLRLLREHNEVRLKWREQIERGWIQAQAGRGVDGAKAMKDARTRLKTMAKKRV